MEIVWIIGLAVISLVFLVLYIRERKACNSYINEENNSRREEARLKNEVSHFKHHSTMHREAFEDAELKIKSLGFSGVDDIQLLDQKTIEKVSKIRASLTESAKLRHSEAEKKKRDAELAEKAAMEARINKLAAEGRARHAILRSQEDAKQQARKYRNQGSFETNSDGLMSFIPAIGAIVYADSGSSGSFSGSGGSFSSDSGSSSSSDSGGGGGGGE